MSEADRNCHACGALNPADYAFCFHCRALASDAPNVSKKSASKKTSKKSNRKK